MTKHETKVPNWSCMSLLGGSNSDVYLIKYNSSYLILKLIINPSLSQKIASEIITDYIQIREILQMCGLKIPDLFSIDYKVVSGNKLIYILESFEGISIRDLVYSNIDCKTLKILVSKAKKYINRMPENIPLDICPGNLVINENGEFAFVDFIPPKPWKYKENTAEFKKIKKIFNAFNYEHFSSKKIESYTLRSGRIKRFMFYLNIHISTHQSNIFTTTHNCV